MKLFEITIVYRPSSKRIQVIDKIESDDIIQLLSQFNLVIVNLQRTIHEEELLALRIENDDIPF